MDIGNQHQMVVRKTYSTGAQEWYCPTCGRHFILQWPPNYKRIMLDEGDDTAIHSGGTGGLGMSSAEAQSSEVESEELVENNVVEEKGDSTDLDDPYLSPFADWLGGRGL